MPTAYSLDLRSRVVVAVKQGASCHSAARQFGVGISSAIRWAQRFMRTGSCAATPSGGDHKSGDLEAHKDWLLALVRTEPDLTLTEIRSRLLAAHGLRKSPSCLWRFFARHKITFKKKTLHAAEQDREDIKAARETWRAGQASLDPKHLVFVDETATATNMTRPRGRAPKGERLIGKVPQGHRKTTTVIAALRCDAVTAPFVVDGVVNGPGLDHLPDRSAAARSGTCRRARPEPCTVASANPWHPGRSVAGTATANRLAARHVA